MALVLYRLGRWAYRRAWLVIAGWVVILGLLGASALVLTGPFKDDYTIPGTESQRALDRLEAVFPQVAGASAQAVITTTDGSRVDTDAAREAIEHLTTTIEDLDGIEAVISPFNEYAFESISADGSTAITQVQFSKAMDAVTHEELDALIATADEPALAAANLSVHFGGSVFQDRTFGLSIVEAFGVLFAAIVLIVTFGSFLAAGLPLINAMVGVGISMAIVLIAAGLTPISSTVPLLGLMIGLAVGIDYALFIVSKHRQLLGTGVEPEESTGRSVATAGSAVIFAGVTVIVALLGLLIVGIPFLSVMGVAAAAAVLLAILGSLTLLPAMLGLAGARLIPKPGSRAAQRALAEAAAHEASHAAPAASAAKTSRFRRKREAAPVAEERHTPAKRTMGQHFVDAAIKVPVLSILAVVAILGTLAIPAVDLELSLPDNGREPVGSTQRTAYDTAAAAFGEGRNAPLIVAVDITQTTEVEDVMEGVHDLLAGVPGVHAVSDGTPNPTLDTVIFQVIPEAGPAAAETAQVVHDLRELAPTILDRFGTPAAVTGVTAVMIDISTRLGEALLPFGLVVVGLSFLLLMIVFRSLWVPVKAALGFLLTVFASLGVVVAAFQWGWLGESLHVEPGPILSFLPVLLMAVLFGLSMDYEVFLTSGMREAYVHGANPRQAVRQGFASAARVVTAAALIMFFVFAAFVPEGMPIIKPIALGLAVGILFDAFLVRMIFGPAVMALLGKHAWWLPRWLNRLLPNADVEGESLAVHRSALDWAGDRDEQVLLSEVQVATASGLSEPLSAAVAAGEVLVVAGERTERLPLLAAITGRLPIAAGRGRVAGRMLETEAGLVARQAALLSLDALDADEAGTSVHELLTEQYRLGHPKPRAARTVVRQSIAALNRHLAEEGVPSISADAVMGSLSSAQREAVRVAGVVVTQAPVIAVDLGERSGGDEANAAALLGALRALDTQQATIILGVPSGYRAPRSLKGFAQVHRVQARVLEGVAR